MSLFIEDIDLIEQPYLENYEADRGSVPLYSIECTDGNCYAVAAPDMDALKHMHAYYRLMKMVKTRISDHQYDPERMCISPVWCNKKDTWGDYTVAQVPASEMGKIFLVRKRANNVPQQ